MVSALVVLAVLTVQSRFNDPDMWWHLKTGEFIWNTGSIPHTDLFSFTTNGHAWTAHEWLSQLLIFGAWKLGGLTGLMAYLCLTTSLVLAVEYLLCWVYSGNAKVALAGAVITWFFATVGFSVRPQLLGYSLLACELLILQMGRSRDPRWFLVLPFLFALWVNCHGSFLLGVVVLAVILVCAHIDLSFGSLVSFRLSPRRRLFLASASALSLLALFVNPIGIDQLTYPVNVMLHQPAGVGAVSEWQPLSFDDPRGIAFLLLIVIAFLLVLGRRVELHLDELMLLTIGSALTVRHVRMLFVFGILVAPILCRLLAKSWDSYEFARDRRSPNIVMIALSIVIVCLAFPSQQQLQAQVRNGNPIGAVAFIEREGLSGRMLNDYNYGGYLIWALPKQKVFVDGRADVYEWTGVLQNFADWATLQADPNILLEKYKIDLCLLTRRSPMSYVMPYLPGWKKVYSDEESVVFVRARSSAPIDFRASTAN